MRILHLCTLYPPHVVGGAERSVAFLAETQVRRGDEVGAACISPDPQPRTERNGVSVYRMPHENDFWSEDWPQHNRLERIVAKAKHPFNRALEARFGEVLDDFRPDIVHSHCMVDLSTLAWRAADQRRIPIVHTLRDYDLACTNSAMFHRGRTCTRWHLRCRALTYGKRLQQHRVGGLAAVGRQILEDHLALGYFPHLPEDLRRVIWNPAVVEGAEPGRPRPDRTGRPFTFGYLGQISTAKGVETLLRACRALEGNEWRLVLAGKAADDLARFERMANGLPVEFLGFVDPKELFDQIDVLVVPSIWAEPLPRTILEACAMGVPSLGARVGGIPDLIGHDNDAWLFEPDDDQGLAIRMNRHMTADRQALPGVDAFAGVLAETQPDLVADRYQDLYRRVIDLRAEPS